jgi:3-oxoacyl-[acyl-carrier-protein] synthase III/short-subunit dehydrogenase
MVDSYIFTGIGIVTGAYEVLNSDIEKYIKSGYLEGFDESRIIESLEFQEFITKNPNETAFNYMTGHIMGFKKRYNVVPFPPAEHNFKEAENSLDLCVKAIDIALTNSGLGGNDIDAWFVGTATPHQYAPGIGEFAKAYFTDIDNQAPVYSLTSACVGFNINLMRAISFLEDNPKADHVVVAHAEVMSALLPTQKDFVAFSTFGDASAAVILSKVKTSDKQGVIAVVNHEDTRMLDFLGADSKGNLYMNPRMVKMRAVPNMTKATQSLLTMCNWSIEDLSWFIPHQTGNAIVDSVTKNLNISNKKVFKEIQINYGNLSGSSVPACFSLLEESGRLSPRNKIIASVAGLGGEFGGFAYVVPDYKPIFTTKKELNNKLILITGATGGLGREISHIAAGKGADLILHYNSNDCLATKLKNDLETEFGIKVSLIKADFSKDNEIKNFVSKIKSSFKVVNYLINTHAITGSLNKASELTIKELEEVITSNYLSIKIICDELKEIISECILITGSVGEDAQFPGSASYVASKRALRAYAVNLASDLFKCGIRCNYYLPGIIDSGMMSKLEKFQILSSMNMIRQQELIRVNDIANRMLKSVYRLEISNVRISYESNLKVIKDGYLNF